MTAASSSSPLKYQYNAMHIMPASVFSNLVIFSISVTSTIALSPPLLNPLGSFNQLSSTSNDAVALLEVEARFNATVAYIENLFNETTSPSQILPTSPQIPPNQTSAVLLPTTTLNQTQTQNSITYNVPDSPATLLLFAFGRTIPKIEVLEAITVSMGAAVEKCVQHKGAQPIDSGCFRHVHQFANKDEVVIAVADFQEIGDPMTNRVLVDVLRGLAEFMMGEGRRGYRECSFQVDVQGSGLVGSGHLEFEAAVAATA